MEWHRRLFLVFLGPPNEARVTTTLLICFGLTLINSSLSSLPLRRVSYAAIVHPVEKLPPWPDIHRQSQAGGIAPCHAPFALSVQVLHTHVSLGSGRRGAPSPLDSTIFHFMQVRLILRRPTTGNTSFGQGRGKMRLVDATCSSFEQASQFCRSTPCAATISAPKASVLIVCSRFTAASLAGSMCPGRYLVVVLASNRCRRTHRNYFVGAGHGLPTPW